MVAQGIRRRALRGPVLVSALLVPALAHAQTVAVDGSKRHQTIDGFGTCLSGSEAKQPWWQSLYFDDLRASMVRVDITPTFTSKYSNESYCSPWFGQPAPLSLDNGGSGPDGTRTRKYTGPADYSASFGGCSAPIAVMGTDIDANAQLFDFTTAQAVPGLVAQLGASKAAQLGGFKLYASMWSPAPWVKVTSGNTYGGGASPLPAAGVPWPFVWGGNFAGGKLDVSGTPLAVFDDGTGPTSALTQFARGLAAFLHGFQKAFSVQFAAISIQNELTFEEFYNSATYPAAADYAAALKAARAELDKYAELKAIAIIGPEDLMGDDGYAMWQYGSGATTVDKNLKFLAAIAADPAATAAIGGFNIHGYASNGVSSAGASAQAWDWWANGWQASPAAGIPGNVKGFTAYGKTSWMTETSGEKPEWTASSKAGGFPDAGAFSIAVKLHQALTTGSQSAWLYWQLTDGSPSDDSHVETLTDATQLANGPKYVAAKHFFHAIRPGAQRVDATVTPGAGGGAEAGAGTLLASAFVRDASGELTVVLVNEAPSAQTVSLQLASVPAGIAALDAATSSDGAYWKTSSVPVAGGQASVPVPGYGVVTLHGGGASGAADAGAPGPDGGSPPAGDAGGGSVDASLDGGGGNGASAGGSGSSGCGCGVAPSDADAVGGLSALALLAAGARGLRRRVTRARR